MVYLVVFLFFYQQINSCCIIMCIYGALQVQAIFWYTQTNGEISLKLMINVLIFTLGCNYCLNFLHMALQNFRPARKQLSSPSWPPSDHIPTTQLSKPQSTQHCGCDVISWHIPHHCRCPIRRSLTNSKNENSYNYRLQKVRHKQHELNYLVF